MHSDHGDASAKVKEEQDSHVGDASLKSSEEKEEHPQNPFPKVTEEDEEHPQDTSFHLKTEDEFNQFGSASSFVNPVDKPQGSSPTEEDDDVQIIENNDDQAANVTNQLVLYDPAVTNSTRDIEPVPEVPPQYHQSQHFSYRNYTQNSQSRVLPAVGAFTVQCANCFKWRLIPSKEKYEEIRESILQEPFVCESAREWRPDISCDDPADINQDGSRLWAIDKPNISQPPPGWQRLLRIRGEGSTKFADVYYAAPSGKRLRSMVEVQKFLDDHPEYLSAGVTMSQFSFQIPKPLQENYVRKRPKTVAPAPGFSMSRPLEPTEVNPLSWAGPVTGTELQLSNDGPLPKAYYDGPVFQSAPPSAKKQRTKSLAKHTSGSNNNPMQPEFREEESPPSRNGLPFGHL
ncbi:hypothetical protein MKW92_003133 [Papaver armeniacum]|nr:hypothetical protein MKW92_003133 [Papaver armeniacum]